MTKNLFFLLFIFHSTACAQEKEIKQQNGKASFYADKFNGRKTANGEIFNNNDFTAAHNELPFHSLVRVTNPQNNKTVVVRINDRGPFVKGRIIDLTRAAAKKIGLDVQGATKVELILTNLTLLTEEINDAFQSNKFSDCLGNKDFLRDITIELWHTKNLQHMLYIANDLDELNNKANVIIERRAKIYHLLLTGIKDQPRAITAIKNSKDEGFLKTKLYYVKK